MIAVTSQNANISQKESILRHNSHTRIHNSQFTIHNTQYTLHLTVMIYISPWGLWYGWRPSFNTLCYLGTLRMYNWKQIERRLKSLSTRQMFSRWKLFSLIPSIPTVQGSFYTRFVSFFSWEDYHLLMRTDFCNPRKQIISWTSTVVKPKAT